ncbi:hypothetical protein [Ancylobacter moscoviensis]
MLSRRSMLRALGLGAPAAAVAAAFGLPKLPAPPAPTGFLLADGSITAANLPVAALSAISGDLGPITAGKIIGGTRLGEAGSMVFDLDGGTLTFSDDGPDSDISREEIEAFYRDDDDCGEADGWGWGGDRDDGAA